MKITSAVDEKTGRKVLQIDPSLERAVEVPYLLGDNTLAREVLGWEPTIPFEVSSSPLLLVLDYSMAPVPRYKKN